MCVTKSKPNNTTIYAVKEILAEALRGQFDAAISSVSNYGARALASAQSPLTTFPPQPPAVTEHLTPIKQRLAEAELDHKAQLCQWATV
jgi:hypothetical protein